MTEINLQEVLATALQEMLTAQRPTLGVKKLHEDAIIPSYAHSTDSGFDLHSIEEGVLYQGQSAMIRTGLAFSIPEGFEIQVRPRSGLAAKKSLQSHFGTVDQAYRGEVAIIMFNHSHTPFTFKKGDKLAQGVLAPILQAKLVEIDNLDETDRGTNGFGSTGV